MENIAKALVLAIQYLGTERNDNEFTEDDDLKIVEEVALIIQEATEQEKKTLIKASKEFGLDAWADQIGIE